MGVYGGIYKSSKYTPWGQLGMPIWDNLSGKTAGEAAAKATQEMMNAQKEREAKLEKISAMTPWELSTLQAEQKQIEAGIVRQEKLLAAADPVLMESGRQALQMMQGGESAASAPVMQARARQRQQLESQLRNRLGSGYATSSAGIEALTKFDQESQMMQTQIMGQLMNYSAGAYGAVGAGFGGAQQFGSLAGQLGQIQGRQVAALTGAPLASGSPEAVQGMIQAQGTGNVINMGFQALGGIFGGAGGAMAAKNSGAGQQNFGAYMPQQQQGNTNGNYGGYNNMAGQPMASGNSYE